MNKIERRIFMKLVLELETDAFVGKDCYLIDAHWCKETGSICLGNLTDRPNHCPFKEKEKKEQKEQKEQKEVCNLDCPYCCKRD